MKMKREGAVGLILIAILVVVMLVFLRGKSLEDILGSGYTQADVTEITATLTPNNQSQSLSCQFAAGEGQGHGVVQSAAVIAGKGTGVGRLLEQGDEV